MTLSREDVFVGVDWLASHLDAPDVVAVDGTWHLPTAGRDAGAEYLAGHIPGAVFFDVDRIADPTTGLPHMLAKPKAFASAMRKMGIGDGQRIVVYDVYGLFSAPRVWWTFKTMGARDVVILDGGLPAWITAGKPLEAGPVTRRERHFTARIDNTAVRGIDDVRAALASGSVQVVDARPRARFTGEQPEPRPGLKSGHMPGALNVPFDQLVEKGRLKAPDALKAVFEAAGVDPARPAITTCGSGVTAALAGLALATLGGRPAPIYDGAWAEWGGRDDTEVETGA